MRSKSPLLLLPGLACDAGLWEHQLRDLGELASITVPDLRDFESIEAMARSVLALAPPRFALAGLSMGGYVAQAMLRAAPERIERMALLDTTARADSSEQTAARRSLIALAEGGAYDDALALLLERLIHPSRRVDAALCDAILAMERRVGPDAFVRQQRAIIGRTNGLSTLAASRMPLLVVYGDGDAIAPPEVHREMAAVRPDATLVAIAACGHMSTMERPAAVSAALAAWLGAGDDSSI